MYDIIGYRVSSLTAQLALKMLLNDSTSENAQVGLLVQTGYMPFLSKKAETCVWTLFARFFVLEKIHEKTIAIDFAALNRMSGKTSDKDGWTIAALDRALVDRMRLDAVTINSERPSPEHWNLCEEFRQVVRMSDSFFSTYMLNVLERK